MIQHLFTVPSSLLVHNSALAPNLPLLLLLNSSQLQNSFFLHFLQTLILFLLQNLILSCQPLHTVYSSTFLPFPHFSPYFQTISFFSLLSVCFPLQLLYFHHHTDFTSFTTSSPSLPSPCFTALSHRNRWKYYSHSSFPTHEFFLPFTKLQDIVRQPFITVAELNHVARKYWGGHKSETRGGACFSLCRKGSGNIQHHVHRDRTADGI